MLSKYDATTSKVVHFAVNSCLTPLCSVHEMAVTTIEGIGSTKTRLHPVQESIAKSHGSQCGFCTPGIIMSMYALLRSKDAPLMKDMEAAFQGNLCRCTGYRPIIEAYKPFTMDKVCAMGKNCCRNVEINNQNHQNNNVDSFVTYDKTQEPLFPTELLKNANVKKESSVFVGPRVSWYRPSNMTSILTIKKKYPYSKIVVGNSEIGVETKFKNKLYTILIDPKLVFEMNNVEVTHNGIRLGASVPLSTVETTLRNQIKVLHSEESRLYQTIVDMLHLFAGKQIRNVASIGGNIMTASPISDLNPIFVAAGIE